MYREDKETKFKHKIIPAQPGYRVVYRHPPGEHPKGKFASLGEPVIAWSIEIERHVKIGEERDAYVSPITSAGNARTIMDYAGLVTPSGLVEVFDKEYPSFEAYLEVIEQEERRRNDRETQKAQWRP